METPVNYGVYDAASVQKWKGKALERLFRDIEFYARIRGYFNEGTVLELGGAVGNVARILEDLGFEVTGSDYFDFFVEYQRKIGLRALKIDATDISKDIDEKFDNIVAQGLSPLMRRDPVMVPKTYESMHRALKPAGRVIAIQSAYRHKPSGRKTYLTLKEQLEIIDDMELFDVVRVIRHQFVHHRLYSHFNKRFLAWLDSVGGSMIPFRHIMILEKKPLPDQPADRDVGQPR